MSSSPIFPKLKSLCTLLCSQFDQIPEKRKKELRLLSDYISKKYQADLTPKINVICTHNSRRSHMGQLWLSVAAKHFGLPDLESFSGGTATTAFNPRAVRALQDLGFEINTDQKKADNPVYQIRWQEQMSPYAAFSKRYDDPPNPTKDFAAILVCTSADRGCPLVAGCDFRLALSFSDPKEFDHTPLAGAKYEERARDIGREFLYVFSIIDRPDIM